MKRTNNRFDMSHDEKGRFPFIRVNGLDFSRRIYSKYGHSVKPRRFLSLVFRRLTNSQNRTLISNFYITRVINTNFNQYLNTFKNVIQQLDLTQISNRLTKNLHFQGFFPLQIPEGKNDEQDARKDYMQPYLITTSYKAGWPIMSGTKYPTTILKRLHPSTVLSGKTGDLPADPLESPFNQEDNTSFLQGKFESYKIADYSTSIHSITSSSHQEGPIRDRIIYERIHEPGSEPSGSLSGSINPHLSRSLVKKDSPAPKKDEQTTVSSRKSRKSMPEKPEIPVNKNKLRLVKEENHSLDPFIFKKSAILVTDENSELWSMLNLAAKKDGREWVSVIQAKDNLPGLEHSTFLDTVMRKYPSLYREEVISNNLTNQNTGSQNRDRKNDMPLGSDLQSADAFQHIDNRQEHSTFHDNVLQKYPQDVKKKVFLNNFTRQGVRPQDRGRKIDMPLGSDLQSADAFQHIDNRQEQTAFHDNVLQKYPQDVKEKVFLNNFTRQGVRPQDRGRKNDMPLGSDLQSADAFQHINNRQETSQLIKQELKNDITTGISDLIMRKPRSHDIKKSSKDISEDIRRSINRKNISAVVTETRISKKDETNIIADKVYKMIENKLLIEKERRGIT